MQDIYDEAEVERERQAYEDHRRRRRPQRRPDGSRYPQATPVERDERPERPFGGDFLFFLAVALTLIIPFVGVLFGIIDMGGRSQARRMKGLGLLLFGLFMMFVYYSASQVISGF